VLQAKPRHAGGILTPSGKPEPFNDQTFAQEVWQMLYSAYAQHRIKHLEYQTSLSIVMHGVQMRIGCTDVPKTYIEGITTTEEAPSDLYVRRTYPIDMQEVDQRPEGLRWIIGLFRYLVSDEIYLGLVQGLRGSADKVEAM
jgi:hypothetical protein